MEVNLSWHIEDWKAPCENVDYDKTTSLQLFLRREKVSEKTIEQIINSKTMFADAFAIFNSPDRMGKFMFSIYSDEMIRFKKLLQLLTIEGNKNAATLNFFWNYLMMVIGLAIRWDFEMKNTSYESAYEKFLVALLEKDTKYVYKTIGETEISCFFLVHFRSERPLTELISEGLQFIEINSRHQETPMGNLYLTLGQDVINGFIKKLFEIIYTTPKFSLKTLLFSKNAISGCESLELKYNVTFWKQHNGFFLIPKSHQDEIIKDLSIINKIILDATKYKKEFSKNELNKETLKFDVTSDNVNDFCFFEYKPLTPTGKKAKYPLILHFYTKAGNLFGEASYMTNSEIGKARIIIWTKECYTIDAILDKTELVLSKIETTDSNFNKILVYKR